MHWPAKECTVGRYALNESVEVFKENLSQHPCVLFCFGTLSKNYESDGISLIPTTFFVGNGGRQGGVLSPIPFTVYMKDLLEDGCPWDHHYVGAIC